MRWIVESLTTIVLYLVTTLLDLLGNGVIEILTLNIGMADGGQKSVFDVVFSSVFTFTGYFRWFALGILLINFLWQLIRIMVSRDGTGETPFALTARTFAAGIGIYASTQLIRIAEYFFSVLYQQILGTSRASFSFGAPDLTGVLGAVDGLVCTLLTLIFSLLIGWEFLMFLAEIVERYVILGVLYYTSPLAFAMAGSKSTSSVFSSWIRMVISQLMLMCFNVFFYRLFIDGYGAYGVAVADMGNIAGGLSHGGIVIIWNLMMYAILHVGTRMDAYMATLGLSTAQAGRGLATAITSTLATTMRTMGAASYLAGKVTSPIRNSVGQAMGNYKSSRAAPTKDKSNTFTADSISAVAQNKSGTKELSGKEVGGRFVQSKSDFKNDVLAGNMDLNTARVSAEDGCATMRSRPDANGETKDMRFIPVTPENREALEKQQAKFGMVDGVEYAMVVDGSQNARAQVLAGGPEMQKANQDWVDGGKGRSCEPIRDEHGDLTGGYHFEQRDKNGKVTNSFDIQPTTMMDAESVPPTAQRTTWGGQDCYKVDTTARDTGTDGLKHPLPQSDGQRMASNVNDHFTAPPVGETGGGLKAQTASMNQQGIIEATAADGTRVGLAPANSFQPAAGVEGTKIRHADNGAAYVQVPLGTKADGSPVSAAEAFQSVTSPGASGYSGISIPDTSAKGADTKAAAQTIQSQMSTPLNADTAHSTALPGVFTTTTAAHTNPAGQKMPAENFAYAPVSGYTLQDVNRPGVETVSARSGEALYRVPLQQGETAADVFQSAQSGAVPATAEIPQVGHVSPVDVMSTARQNFQGEQIPQDMTHCESLPGGAMRMWNPQTQEAQFVVPTSGFTTEQPHGYYTAATGAAYMVIPAQQGAQLADVATERSKDAQGQYLTAELKAVPEPPTRAPSTAHNKVFDGARRKGSGGKK